MTTMTATFWAGWMTSDIPRGERLDGGKVELENAKQDTTDERNQSAISVKTWRYKSALPEQELKRLASTRTEELLEQLQFLKAPAVAAAVEAMVAYAPRTERVETSLLSCLSHPSRFVRERTARALSSFSSPHVLARLRKVADQDPDKEVRSAATESALLVDAQLG